MAKTEVDEVTESALNNGGLLVKFYFDMESEKKEDLQPLMADLINNRLLKTTGVVYCYGSIEEPIKTKETYVTNATVTALVKDLRTLVGITFTFSPAGLEILRPQKDYPLKISEMQSILLSLSQTAADYSQYILSRVLTKEDYEKIKLAMQAREEIGKKMLSKKDANAGEKKD
ncbi:MAG: hypothetical protein KGH72_01000 [Candidatus Micrarchaeota archaeon]|nr:hypothetical protein [Candidatus Micrarchaeota archaeon]